MIRQKKAISLIVMLVFLTFSTGTAAALTLTPTQPIVTQPIVTQPIVTQPIVTEPPVLTPVKPPVSVPTLPKLPVLPGSQPVLDTEPVSVTVYAVVVQNAIKLSWLVQGTEIQKISAFRIYRTSSQDRAGLPLTDFDITETSYLDTNVKTGIAYKYIIRPVFTDGKEGDPSNEVNVEILRPPTVVSMRINSSVMTVNGSGRQIDSGRSTSPVIINGRTYVPVRAVAEAFGAQIQWNAKDQTIILATEEAGIKLQVGSTVMYPNPPCSLCGDKPTTMDVAPVVQNGRTLLPVRYIAEGLGWTSTWDSQTKTVNIIKGASSKTWPVNYLGDVSKPEGDGDWKGGAQAPALATNG